MVSPDVVGIGSEYFVVYFKKTDQSSLGTYIHTSTSSTAVKNLIGYVQQAVQETANSRTWNHIFKFRRRGL